MEIHRELLLISPNPQLINNPPKQILAHCWQIASICLKGTTMIHVAEIQFWNNYFQPNCVDLEPLKLRAFNLMTMKKKTLIE